MPDDAAFEQHESNVRVYCRHFPTVFERALAERLYDEEGVEYIDVYYYPIVNSRNRRMRGAEARA